MKPNIRVIYLIDNTLLLWKDSSEDVIKEIIPNGLLKDGKVARPKEFITFIKYIDKKYHINKYIKSNKLYVIHDPGYTKSDLKILYDCLEKLNVDNIKFINILKILKLDNKTMWIIMHNKYMYLIKKQTKQIITNIFIDYTLFNNNLNQIIKHIKKFYNINKRIIILGSNNNISEFAKKLETNTSIKTYYINKYLDYITSNIKNTLK